VRFRIEAELANPIACRCRQCRRQSGHHFAAAPAPFAALEFDADRGLSWYRQSELACRGFCRLCGSSLFWHSPDSATVMVAMGALDDTGDLKLSGHYWVEAKGTYYEMSDGIPQNRGDET
jgi:hypothetical protein